ncbi:MULTISPECIES: RAD55 family ATPase [Halorussus]|uniref:RAD55 family ATPase n=1 Tax=Halorussus TaxID=1070314 RepID=UPI0020A17F5D|nr:ATPase domain-containing protein [Halorussus vallis]USZ75786.1 recombinase RecA [Halorussus vallis]
MYGLGEARPEVEVEPGTNLLIAGPPMTGKRTLAMGILAHGSRRGDGSIVVTTKDSGGDVREAFEEQFRGQGDDPTGPLAIVDCVSKQQGRNPAPDDVIRYASSPVDMTGIGIQLSEFLQEFYEDRGVRQNRILLYSLSTLLMYSNLQTVFRFLHVFTGRVQSADALGVFVIDSTAHDDQTMSTLKQLFDGQIEVREGENRERELRLTGVGDDADWRPVAQ